MNAHLHLRLYLVGKLVSGTTIVVLGGAVLRLLGLFAEMTCRCMYLGSSGPIQSQSLRFPLRQVLSTLVGVRSCVSAPHR